MTDWGAGFAPDACPRRLLSGNCGKDILGSGQDKRGWGERAKSCHSREGGNPGGRALDRVEGGDHVPSAWPKRNDAGFPIKDVGNDRLGVKVCPRRLPPMFVIGELREGHIGGREGQEGVG